VVASILLVSVFSGIPFLNMAQELEKLRFDYLIPLNSLSTQGGADDARISWCFPSMVISALRDIMK